jgi:hypothetical protein
MANYATSVLAKGQAVVTDRNQAPEQRRKVPTVMELALRNQEYSIPNANELRKSDLRAVEIYYQKDVAAGVTTAKAYNHTGTFGDSGKIELTYVTHVEKIQLPRKIAQNNILTYQNMFNNLYEIKWKNLRTRHDTSALAFLIAQRCQLTAAVVNAAIASANPGTWEDAGFSLGIDATNSALFIQKVKSFMAARKYTGELDIISDLQLVMRLNTPCSKVRRTIPTLHSSLLVQIFQKHRMWYLLVTAKVLHWLCPGSLLLHYSGTIL